MPEREYQRLTRPRVRHKNILSSVSTRSSLWLGKDHLLSIDSNRYSEEYKRFYFRDIQAITIRTTKRRATWNLVFGLLFIIWLGTFVSVDAVQRTNPFFALWFVFLGVPLLLNNTMGPTCATYLRTAVQIEVLPSLNRVRRARRILDRIRPAIMAAQEQQVP